MPTRVMPARPWANTSTTAKIEAQISVLFHMLVPRTCDSGRLLSPVDPG